MSNTIKQNSVVVEKETKVDEPKGGESMKDLENIKVLDSDPHPSFYEDDNGKKFFISKGWYNDALVRSFDADLVDEYEGYDDLREKIGIAKLGNREDYNRTVLLKRLRELGYQAIAVSIYDDETRCPWIAPRDDDYMSWYHDGRDGILYTRKNVDLKEYIKLYNMNGTGLFVRILTSDWKISRAVPWIISDSWTNVNTTDLGPLDLVHLDGNTDLSPYAIEELHKLGIKIQKVYKELKWGE